MPWSRDRVSWLLLALAAGCLAAGLFPQSDWWVDPDTGDRVSEFRLGLWPSPVFSQVRREPPQGGYKVRGQMHWLSWSTVLVVAGVSCLQQVRSRRAGFRQNRAQQPAGS